MIISEKDLIQYEALQVAAKKAVEDGYALEVIRSLRAQYMQEVESNVDLAIPGHHKLKALADIENVILSHTNVHDRALDNNAAQIEAEKLRTASTETGSDE